MPRLALMLLAVLSFAACAPLGAAVTPPDFPQDHAADALGADPAVTFGHLDNGLRYCLMRNSQPKDKVTLRLQVQNGSLEENDDQRGLAHYLEHMAFDGTAHFPPGKLVELLQSLGLAFGAHTNAHTSFDETVYKLDMPDTRPETIATGLKVMSDWAGSMLLLPEQVEKERGVILAEMRDRNDPDYREFLAASQGIYRGTLISQRMPIGVKETVSAATAPLMRAYYNDWYRPEMMVLAVVGDIDVAAVKAQIQAAFGPITARSTRGRPSFGVVTPGLEFMYIHEPEDTATAAEVSMVRPRVRPHDSLALRRTELLQDIAHRIFDRRMADLVEKNPTGPILGATMSSGQWLQIWQASVDVQCRPAKSLDALRDAEIERNRMLRYGPTAAELKVTLDAERSDLEQAVAQSLTRTNTNLANALYSSVYHDEVFLSPTQERDLYEPMLATITTAEVTKALNDEWADDGGHTTVTVTGRDDLGKDAETAIRGAYDIARSSHIDAPAERQAATWAYGTVADSGAIAADQALDPQIRALRFANHAAVNLKHSDFQPGQVLIAVRLTIPPIARQPGLSDLTSMAFLDGGLGKHTAQDLREIFAPTSVQEQGLRFDDDGAVMELSCLPKDLEFALQVIRAYITDPAWRDEAASRAKTAWIEAMRSLDTNLDAQVQRTFEFNAVDNMPQRRPVTLDEAQLVTIQQCQGWFTPYLQTAPLEVTIVGDIDLAVAGALAKHYIGSLGERRPLVLVTDPPGPGVLAAAAPMPAKTIMLDVPGTNPRALMLIGWPTDDFYDVKKLRRLGMLAQAMGEKLRVKVRNELGQAYSPYAFRTASEAYQGVGFMGAMVGVAPDKAEIARKAILDIATDLATNGVNDELMGRIRAPIIKNLQAQRQRNDYWLNTVLLRLQEQPFRLAWSLAMEVDYGSITAAELSALAKQYLINAKALQVIGVCKGAAPASAAVPVGGAPVTAPAPAPTPAPAPAPAPAPPAATPAGK